MTDTALDFAIALAISGARVRYSEIADQGADFEAAAMEIAKDACKLAEESRSVAERRNVDVPERRVYQAALTALREFDRRSDTPRPETKYQ